VSRPAKVKGLKAWTIGVGMEVGPFYWMEFRDDELLLQHSVGVASDWHVWSFAANKPVNAPFEGNFAALCPNNKNKEARIHDKVVEIRTWEKGAVKSKRNLLGADSSVGSVFWAPDGKHVAASADGFYVWNLDSVDPPWKVKAPSVQCGQPWSPDGKNVAIPTIGNQFYVLLCEGDSGKQFWTLDCPGASLLGSAWLTWSPDGKKLALVAHDGGGGGGGVLLVWEVTSGKPLPLPKEMEVVAGAAPWWSPDGKKVAVAGSKNTVAVYDVETGKESLILRGHARPVLAGLFTRDGKTLVSAAEDRTVRFWDAASGEPRGVLIYLSNGEWVTISPDGHYRGSDKIEQFLSYTVNPEEGEVHDLTPAEFAKQYDWKNDPDKVKLLNK
jgi:WD40 repeat protein